MGSLIKENKTQMFVTYDFNNFQSIIVMFHFINVSTVIGISNNKDLYFIIHYIFANNLNFF